MEHIRTILTILRAPLSGIPYVRLLGSHHHHPPPEHSHCPLLRRCPHETRTLIPPSPQTLAATILLCVCAPGDSRDLLYEDSHSVCPIAMGLFHWA